MSATPHSDRAHAKLAPSAAHRWIECPGSIRMSEGIPNRSSSYANEGTAAHEVASRCLEEGKDADAFLGWLINTHPAEGKSPFYLGGDTLEPADGETTFEVDEDMADAVQIYLDHIREIAASDGAAMVSFEQRLDMSDLHPGIFGTGDATIYLHDARWLHVVDYKHGKGVSVEVDQNPQLLLYGAGAARRHHNLPLDGVTLHVVQPRAPHRDGPVRSFSVDLLDLLDFEQDIRVAAAKTDDPDAPLHAGDHCRFCPAAPVCMVYRDLAMERAGAEFTDDGELTLPAPEEMTPEHRGRVLTHADFIANWTKAVQKFEHDQALAGQTPDGFKLVAKRATRRWRDGDEVIGTLQVDLGLSDEDIFERKMRSPAQLERHFPGKNKVARAEAMAGLITKESSGTNLVPVSDPRPAVKVEASEEFGE